MKMKSINKILTSILSISLLMGSALPVLAEEEGVVDVPIFSLDITNVIVPTSYAVAFNPEKLPVVTGPSVSSNDQILSKNYGIINKSSKDKLITVTLNVEDQNGDDGITFVSSDQDVSDAKEGEYKVHLTAIPADTTEVQVAGDSADEETAPKDLDDVTMTKAGSNAVTLMSGENYLGFKLEKAVWTTVSGNELTLGTTNSNDVKDNFEISGLAAAGKGITAFTFGGTMNENADWSKLTQGIKITVIYGNDKVASDATVISGTGAMVKVNIAPTFTTGSEIGQIKYTRGAGDDGLQEIKKVELLSVDGSTLFDGYNELTGAWAAATDEAGVITFASEYMSFWSSVPNREATVTYETIGGETETAKVNVWCQTPSIAPTFTTGSGVGQIKYTMGSGDDGLKEIKKIELLALDGNTLFDGYNELTGSWTAATDEAGVITFASEYISFWSSVPTREATVTYETIGGETRTASLDVKCQ